MEPRVSGLNSSTPEELSSAPLIRQIGQSPAGSAEPSSAPALWAGWHLAQIRVQAVQSWLCYCCHRAANLRGRDSLFTTGAPDRAPAPGQSSREESRQREKLISLRVDRWRTTAARALYPRTEGNIGRRRALAWASTAVVAASTCRVRGIPKVLGTPAAPSAACFVAQLSSHWTFPLV